jgi:hypothetical protein
VAIDKHLRSFARDAAVTNLGYDGLRELYTAAARPSIFQSGDGGVDERA